VQPARLQGGRDQRPTRLQPPQGAAGAATDPRPPGAPAPRRPGGRLSKERPAVRRVVRRGVFRIEPVTGPAPAAPARVPEAPMSEPGEPDPPSATGVWRRREQIFEAFEAALRRAERPDLDAHLAAAGPARPAVLPELARAELEARLRAGEAARVEDYLDRYPELRGDPAAVIELLAAEYGQRQRHEPGLSFDEYARRFPEYREPLRERWPAAAGAGTGGKEGAPATEGGPAR